MGGGLISAPATSPLTLLRPGFLHENFKLRLYRFGGHSES